MSDNIPINGGKNTTVDGVNKKRRAPGGGNLDSKISKRIKSNNESETWSDNSSYSDMSSHFGISFSDSDSVTGNDSSDYNERCKYGGTYMLQDTRVNAKFNHGSGFKCEATDEQFAQSEESQEDIKSHISKIEEMFSSFVKNVGYELKVLKQLTEAPSTSNAMAPATMLESERNEIYDREVMSEKEDPVDTATFFGSNIVTLPIVFESSTETKDLNLKSVPNTNELVNAAVNANVASISDGHAVPVIAFDTTFEQTPRSLAPLAPNADYVNTTPKAGMSSRDRVLSNDEVPKSLTVPKPAIHLPIKGIPHYEDIQNLLEDEDILSKPGAILPLERTLIKHLLPIANEPEAKYMNRSIELLFDPPFFVSSICWKKEKNRVNIKNGYLLTCWKKSFVTQFGSDENNSRFMAHFRRYKGAKRAAGKAEERKRLLPTGLKK